MADVITRFKLETTQFDSKLRDTAKALKDVTHQASLGGKDFDNFSKKAIESARALGTVQSGATNTKDKLRDLVGSYNDAAKAYNELTDAAKKGEFGRAMSTSLQQLQQRIRETKQELYSLGDSAKGIGGGGLFGGGKLDGMLQVFGGNLMTKGAGMLAGLATEMGDMVKQGIELAKQGEGIRIAFQRLGRGDILDGLRKATHGTVTDLELMKAAVKFNDFKLPLEELGTMLAFAQQKAKDTGQSVDYMVDSIVTGLGRKSLMILDNLGLSAAQIKDKMAETGDMTKAVGAIIREEMAKAGDYVETAADRATQANVNLQNKMEELGRKFAPLEEASNNFWTSMKIGILDVVGGPLTNLLNKLTEAGRLMGAYGKLGGNTKVNRMIANLAGARQGNRQSIYQQQQSEIWKYINPREQQLKDIRAWQRGERNDALKGRIQSITAQYGSLDATKIQAEVDAAKKMLVEYQQAAKSLLTPVKADINTDDAQQSVASLTKKLKELQEQRKKAIAAGDTDLSKNLLKQINQVKADIKGLGGTTTTTTTHKPTTAEQIAFDINKAGISSAKGVDTMPSVWQMLGEKGRNAGIGSIAPELSADIEKQQALVDELREKWAGATGDIRDSIVAMVIDAEDKLRNLKDEQGISQGDGRKPYDLGKDISEKDYKKLPGYDKNKDRDEKKLTEQISKLTSGISSITGGIKAMGIKLPSEVEQVIGVVQGVMAVIEGVNTVISIFGSTSMALNTIALDANTAALWAVAGTNLIPGLARGGIVPHAAGGYLIPGNNNSGDNVFAGGAWVNSGELVLSKAQQGNLASQLSGSGLQNLHLTATVHAEQIRLALNNNGQRTGRGELVTWKR